MWILITDRKLKRFKAYGPFDSAETAQTIADKLNANGMIKNEYSVIKLASVRIENGQLMYVAEI